MSAMLRTAAVGTSLVVVLLACAKVPYTERSQFNAIPNGIMNNMGRSTYDEILAQSQVERGSDDAQTLKRVGNRIAKEADQPNYDWSFAMIKDAQINAWCLPGGYIGFYQGILPVLNNEAGMAFVMGHEVGHAVARHSGERMSQELGLMGALSLIDMFLSGSGSVTEDQRGLIMGALGVGAQFGVQLPFSRSHEKEADIIGMMFMAEAGYPPAESMKVWSRMGEIAGEGPPPFLSTHPSNANRIANQEEWLPQAQKKYRRNKRDGENTLASAW